MKGPHFLWRAETIVGLYCVLPGGGEILREGDGANFFGGRLPRAVGGRASAFGCRLLSAAENLERNLKFQISFQILRMDDGHAQKVL